MGKHLNNIISLIKRNPAAFVIINHIVIAFTLIPFVLGMTVFRGAYFHTFGSSNYDIFNINYGLDFSSYSFLLDIIWVMVLMLVVSIVINSFTLGGYYSYLNSKEGYKNPISLFFVEGAKKFWKVLGTSFLQTLLVLLTTIIVSLVIGFTLGFIVISAGTDQAIVIIQYISRITYLIVIIFFFFMTNEAILTNKSIGQIISGSFSKIKKVFWPYLGFLVLRALVFRLFNLAPLGFIAMVIIDVYLVQIFNTFIDFPLYMHASDIVGETISSSPEGEW